MNTIAPAASNGGIVFVYATDSFQGGALAVVDLDGDDLPEIVAARRDGGNVVLRNRGGLQFEAVATGIDASLGAHAIAAVDLDNDGDRDVVLAAANVAYLFANQGNGTFREAGQLIDSGMTEHVLATDLDSDGALDLYFSNYDLRNASNSENRLYRNNGGIEFAPAVRLGAGLSWAATAFDVDDDGDRDLYVANDTLVHDSGDAPPPTTSTLPVDLLLRNDGRGRDGWRFTDVAADFGLATPRSSMGGLVGDFDGDNRLDLFVTNFGAKKLFVRDETNHFVDRAAELGVVAARRNDVLCADSQAPYCLLLSWSAAASDFDLDGFDELLVDNGVAVVGDVPPALLFTRGDELVFREVTPLIGCIDARGLVVTDLDLDGDQDIVVAPANGLLQIFETRGRPAPQAWLRVLLHGHASNREGIGAVIAVRMSSGRMQTRVVAPGGTVHSASPPEAFFGLGRDRVDRVEILWPSGKRSERIGPVFGTIVVEEL